MTKKILGVTKIYTGFKMGMLRKVANKLQASIGDEIIFFEENGRIYIEKA